MTDTVILESRDQWRDVAAANPNVPYTPEQIRGRHASVMDTGAAIVHNHIDKFGLPAQEAADRYLEGWRPVFAARPDALLYPTINTGPTVEASFLAHRGARRRGRHAHRTLRRRLGELRQRSTSRDSTGGFVYRNSHDDAGYQMELCGRLRLGPSMAVFEPGFLRTIAAWWTRGALPAGGMIKLYFGGESGYLGGTGLGVPFGLPPTRRALDTYLELLDGIEVPWSAAVLGGDLGSDPGFVEAVLDAGGHLHVGLEDCNIVGTRANVELVETAVAIIEKTGRAPRRRRKPPTSSACPHAEPLARRCYCGRPAACGEEGGGRGWRNSADAAFAWLILRTSSAAQRAEHFCEHRLGVGPGAVAVRVVGLEA